MEVYLPLQILPLIGELGEEPQFHSNWESIKIEKSR